MAHNFTSRNQSIDFMRGLAIIMVVLVHYGQTFGNPCFTRFGQMGCQIFFFTAGYGCSISYNRSKSNLEFYKKRFLSIAPGFYTGMFVVVTINTFYAFAFNRAGIGVGNVSSLSVICNTLFLHGVLPFCNNSVFPGAWYIGTTAIFYLIHPILNKALKDKNRMRYFIYFWALMTLSTIVINRIYIGSDNITNNSFCYFLFSNQAGSYMLGIIAYYQKKENKKSNPQKENIILSTVFLLLCIVLFYNDIIYSFSLITVCMGLFSYFLFFSLESLCSKLNKQIIFLGNNSFFVYLTHIVVVWNLASLFRRVLDKLNISVPMQFCICFIPCALIIGILSWGLKKIVEFENKLIGRMCRSDGSEI